MLKKDILDSDKKMADNLIFEIKYKNDVKENDDFLEEIEFDLSNVDFELEKLNAKINSKTCKADFWDYVVAISSGVFAGLIDNIFIGKWDFIKAKNNVGKILEKKIINLANSKTKNASETSLKAVRRLEMATAGFPGDNDWKHLNANISASSHHLDDFCHHPTLIGYLSCLRAQFENKVVYYPVNGSPIGVDLNPTKGVFYSKSNIQFKFFCGTINWIILAANTLFLQKYHLASDVLGSSTAIKNGNRGAGIPGPILSTIKELSELKCFRNTNFSSKIANAFAHGIGDGKNQVDLKILNCFFEGSNGFDFREELAIGHELKRQAIPIVINEMIVKAFYFVRRLIIELKEKKNIENIDWKNVFSINSRTIVRMTTVSLAAFNAVDQLGALICGAVSTINPIKINMAENASKSNVGLMMVDFAKETLLRINIVGVGRFVISLGNELLMDLSKNYYKKEVGFYKNKELHISESKLFYGEKKIWEAKEGTEEEINRLRKTIQDIYISTYVDVVDITKNIDDIMGINNDEIEINNKGLLEEMLEALK